MQSQAASAIQNFTFQSFTIAVGTRVAWTNLDAVPHTATSGTPGSPSGVWDTGFLGQGQSGSFTFTQIGTYPYYCRVHPSMIGTVTVTTSGSGGASGGGGGSGY